MISDDNLPLVVAGGILLVCAGAIYGIHQATSRIEPELDDVTALYAIDAALPGHRVYRIAPIGHGQVIYVVTKDGEAVATRYREPGKHGKDIEAVTP